MVRGLAVEPPIPHPQILGPGGRFGGWSASWGSISEGPGGRFRRVQGVDQPEGSKIQAEGPKSGGSVSSEGPKSTLGVQNPGWGPKSTLRIDLGGQKFTKNDQKLSKSDKK